MWCELISPFQSYSSKNPEEAELEDILNSVVGLVMLTVLNFFMKLVESPSKKPLYMILT